jgi:hypothetical protein
VSPIASANVLVNGEEDLSLFLAIVRAKKSSLKDSLKRKKQASLFAKEFLSGTPLPKSGGASLPKFAGTFTYAN